MSDTRLCHCGKPLHYTNDTIKGYVDKLIEEQGEFLPTTVGGRTWLVPRHFMALHGLKGASVHAMEFEEVTKFQLPDGAYPITIEALHPKTRSVVWSKKVEATHAGKNPDPVYMPLLRKRLGHPIAMRIRFADGSVKESAPPELVN